MSFLTVANLKKAASYVGAVAGILTSAVMFAQGDTGNGINALLAALAAFGVNLPTHVQVASK